MARPRRSRRLWVTIAVLVLLSITIITIDERGGSNAFTSGIRSTASDVFSPVRGGVNAVLSPIGNFFAGAVDYRSLQQENARLRASLGQEEAAAGSARALESQYKQVAALERLPSVNSLPHVIAEVTEYNPSNYESTIQIDKGTNQGVDVDMPVVANGGLVGQVSQAAGNTAQVTLITDGSSRVGVDLPGGSTGVVAGAGQGNAMSVDNVAPGIAVSKGEVLTTNALQDASYPTGLPVARVVSAHSVPGASQQTIRVTSAADMTNLQYVAVLQWTTTP